MLQIFVFAFGTVLGSGINALDWRYGNSVSWLRDRSQCPQCGHVLSWWELIPVVSFFLLGRRCRECGKSISWRYPLVELTAGLLYVLILQQFGLSLAGIFAVVIWSLLLFIYVHDGRTMIIPRWAVWAFNGLALVSVFVLLPADSLSWSNAVVRFPGWQAVAAGPIIAFPFVAIWLASGGKAMGLGDGKLALGIGWLAGLTVGISAVVYAFWIGAAISLALLGFQRVWKNYAQKIMKQSIIKIGQGTDRADQRKGDSTAESEKVQADNDENVMTMKTAVPFGPFLILGLILVYFAGTTLL